MMLSKLFKFAAVSVTFGVVILLEKRRPLRKSVESKLVRDTRNLAVAGIGAMVLVLAEKPVTDRLTKYVEEKNVGLLKIFKLPRFLETVLAVVMLDYTLYLWHVLTHKVPFLWRFHLIHHIDLDLDASTAIRFHFGELIISVAYRAAQIVVIGVSPNALKTWQMFLFPAIIFHHSNIELSPEIDVKLSRLLVTPRLHGIHHSAVQAETDSNWSSGLSIWDKLHGTFRADVPQSEIVIGVPAYQQKEAVVLPEILKLPFENQRPSWQLTDGS
jgi:sterol desaturase/sphingolipid hydroxylase (fatty acid hydroxylase superfamily)